MAAATASSSTTNDGATGGVPKPPLRGVIFDMDGTLTIPNLDFAEMYRRCGVDRNDDILAAIAKMEPADAEVANGIVEEMEEEGRRTLQLMPGTVAVLQWLAFYDIPIALVTRNTYKSTQRLQELLLEADPNLPEFVPIVARDSEPIQPPKPDTTALKYIASQWHMDLSPQLVMVGDSPENDIQFGKTGGIATALLWQREDKLTDNGGADIVVSRLSQLPKQLLSTYSLTPCEKLPDSTAPKPTSVGGQAAFEGDFDKLQSLSLEKLLEKDEFNNTPLIWASEAGHERVVAHILNVMTSQADDDDASLLDSTDFSRGFLGSTAISRAARHGNVPILDLLLKSNNQSVSNPNIPNHKLQYPLHIAAFRQHISAVKRLLQAGADPDVVDQKGRTPCEDTSCAEIQELLQSAMIESHYVASFSTSRVTCYATTKQNINAPTEDR